MPVVTKEMTKQQRGIWHLMLSDLAKEIGERVEDYHDPVTNRPCHGLKTLAKERAGVLWGEDEIRTEMLYEGLIKAAEMMQKSNPKLTPVEFLVVARGKIIKAPIRRRSSEDFNVSEYNAVIEETKRMFFENDLTPKLYEYEEKK